MTDNEHIGNNAARVESQESDAWGNPGKASRVDVAAGFVASWRSRRLWSLWDMLELNAQDFYTTVAELQRLRGVLADEPGTKTLADGGVEIIMLTQDHPVIDTVLGFIAALRESLSVLGARVTLMALEELAAVLEGVTMGEPVLKSTIDSYLYDIDGRFFHELTLTKVLVLSGHEQERYQPRSPLFGSEFAEKFPTEGAFELDEAAKCLALGRPTAAVFHLMRLMEVGIRAMARCLGIPDPTNPGQRNWGKILGLIRADGIEKKWATVAARATGDGALFDSLYASLDAVKNPWRNATMHVENKYTEDEAEHIFVAVKGFMKKLASRCDEDGNPRA